MGIGVDPLNQIIINKVKATKGNFDSELFTSSGTWTQIEGIDHVLITMVGGGGGGDTNATGGGGGAGAFIIRHNLPVDGDLDIVIGTGGAETVNGSDTTVKIASGSLERLRAKGGKKGVGGAGGDGGGFGAQDFGSGAGGASAVGVTGTQAQADLPFYGGSGGGDGGAGGGIGGGAAGGAGGGAGDIFGTGSDGSGGVTPEAIGYGAGGGSGTTGGTGASGFVLIEWIAPQA